MLCSSSIDLTDMPRAPLLGELSAKQTERFLRNSAQKEDPLSELQLREGVFFLASQMTSLITTFIVFIICVFSQKVKHCTESLQA